MPSKFDPQKHHRRFIRLPNYDYSQAGAYFVTIVTWHRKCLFGEVVGAEMSLNRVGKIVQWEWLKLPKWLRYIELGAFIVMPNHFHGIIIFDENVGVTRQGLINADSGTVSLRPINDDDIDGSPLPRSPNQPL